MNAVFVHDHRFRRIDGKVYSPGGLPDGVLSRYVGWFGTVTVVGRIMDEDKAKPNYSQIVNDGVTVVTNDGLKKIIKESDCVIARVPSINGYKAIKYAKIYKKPYLVEIVGCTFDAYWNYGIKGKLLAVPAYFIMRHYVKDAPYALYVTSEFLQKRYPCNGKTIGVSDVEIEAANENVLKKRLEKIASEKNQFVLGTAGAIDVDYKGQEYLIRAIPEIEEKTGMIIKYELAGSGNPKRLSDIADTLGINEKVIFRGVIDHSNIFNWLDNIDIYVQSSLLEGLSRAVIEAMSRGLPCVAANKGGNPEIVERDFLFPTENKNAISHELSKRIILLLAKETHRRVAIRNYNVANSEYEINKLNTKRSQFYLSFVAYCNKNNAIL